VYLCVSGVLKPMITYGKGRRRRFPAINEWLGTGIGGSPPGVRTTWFLSQSTVNLRCNSFLLWVPNLACLKFPLRENIPKKPFLGVAEGRQSIFNICFELTRSSRPYLQGKIVSPIFPLWLIWRCLNYCPLQLWFIIEIWVAHKDLICL
jgi:hypothetical protein